MSDEPKYCGECGTALAQVADRGYSVFTGKPLTRLVCPARKNCDCHVHDHDYEYVGWFCFKDLRCKLCGNVVSGYD